MEMMKFTRGRYRNKTYEEVYMKDPDFCKMVLKERRGPFDETFIEFLLSKMIWNSRLTDNVVIKERGCPHFLKACTPAMRQELKALLGNVRINVKTVHESCDPKVRTNGFLGVFYHFYIKKFVCNLRNVDTRCKYVDNYACIFPFKISKNVPNAELKIFHAVDIEFSKDIQMFLDDHFDDVKFRHVYKVFLLNIYQFKEKHLTADQLLSSNYLKLNHLPFENRNAGRDDLFSKFRNNRNRYLLDFPRLNTEGAEKYQKMYENLINTTNFFNNTDLKLSRKYNVEYFTKLPEINFLELYSLLSAEFFLSNRKEYVKKFKKYLFFFVHALQSDSKPVFFIDDGLYECLKSLRTFKKSRESVSELKYSLAMMTLVYRRKQPIDSDVRNLDETNLQNLQSYLLSLPNIRNAEVGEEVHTNILESMSLVSTDEMCLDSCFSTWRRRGISDFLESILHGAISPKNIKRLIIYNAFYGEQTSIDMPKNKEAIKNFIRTYNKYDFSEKLPAEKSLTWGSEDLYEPGTVDWEAKLKRC